MINKTYEDGTVEQVDEQVVLDIMALGQAQKLVATELKNADLQVKYHEDNDDRASSNIGLWRKYRRDLRNYIQAGAIATDKPTRPV